MLIPVRCFTCNKVIAHLWEDYLATVEAYINSKEREPDARSQALNDIGLTNSCCRRMILGHVDIIDTLLLYSNNPGEDCSDIQYQDLPADYKEPDPVIAHNDADADSDDDDDDLYAAFDDEDDNDL